MMPNIDWGYIGTALFYLGVGMTIGFIWGRSTRAAREAHEALEKVNQLARETEQKNHQRDEGGFMKRAWVTFQNIALLLTVTLTAWAAFSANQVSNRVQKTQDELKYTINCIKQYNVRQGVSLTSRDSAIKAGTESEIKLWTKYAELYAQAKADPSKIPAAQEALNRAILSHRNALIDTQATREDHPYPNPDILQSCQDN